MRRPHPLFKAAALASSILLFCGFVTQRANVFNGRRQPADAATGPVDVRAPEAERAGLSALQFSTASDTTVMSGSKSGPVFVTPAPAATDAGSTIFPSSKGRVVFSFESPPENRRDAAVMGGSKSLILVPPQAQAATGTPALDQLPSAQRSQ